MAVEFSPWGNSAHFQARWFKYLCRRSLGGESEWIRRPVSRVLCRRRPKTPALAIIPLDRPSRDGSRDLPGPLGATTLLPLAGCAVPIRSCSWRGLPCRPCCQRRGGLLPHPFTLPAPKRGGLLSVALSLGSPPAGVTRRHVVVEPGLSSTPLRRPRPPGRLIRAEPDLWRSRGQGVLTSL